MTETRKQSDGKVSKDSANNGLCSGKHRYKYLINYRVGGIIGLIAVLIGYDQRNFFYRYFFSRYAKANFPKYFLMCLLASYMFF